ncbi:MAG TPA: DsbC family protein [Rhodocyclaceae bacterium]|nr:DsbC family protein [Rhodocyclaceae bacterium]
MLNRILVCVLAALTLAAGFARADEKDIRRALTSVYGPDLKIDALRKVGALGLYEVQVGHDILYSDAQGRYLIQGDIIDVKARTNLTEARKTKLSQIKFSELPLNLAIKTVRGNGRRVFATFEDPNCGYCKKLAKDMVGMTDLTIYTFLIPILSPDSVAKSQAIWCSGDRSKAWNAWMLEGTAPVAAKCAAPMDKLLALADRLGVHGTPTIFLANGERIPGAVPAAQLERELERVASAR